MRAITFVGGQVESKDDAIKEHHTLRKIHEEYSQDSSGLYDWGENFAYQGYTANSVTVGTGKAVVFGRHFEINVAEEVNILDGTSTTQYAYIIAKIDMSQPQSSQVVLTHKAQTGTYPTLTKQDVTGNAGIYEFEIVKFTYTNTAILSIENVARTPFSANSIPAELDNKLDTTAKAADSNLLDGIDSTQFARIDQSANFNHSVHVNDYFTANSHMGENYEFVVRGDTGRVYCFSGNANVAMYIKKAGGYSTSALDYYSTLRLGDVAIHLNDITPSVEKFIYRQQANTDFGVESRQNDEGEDCIFLLDILESMQNKINTLENEVAILKG